MDQKKLISTSATAAIALVLAYWLVSKTKKKDHGDIPSPWPALPIVGHFLALGASPGAQITKWHQQYGPIIKVKMGIQDWYFIGEPDLAHYIFTENGASSSGRPHSIFQKYYSYSGKGIVFSEGEGWKKARGAILSVLAPKMVEQYMHLIEYEASEMADRLVDTTKQEGSVNPRKSLELYSFNVICSVSVGRRYDSIEDPHFLNMENLGDEGVKRSGIEYDLPNYIPKFSFLYRLLKLEDSLKGYIDNIRDPLIKKMIKEAQVKDGPNVMKALSDKQFDFDEDDKVVIMSDLIAAGTETQAIILSWSLAILCQYPDDQKKIQDELDAFIRDHGRLPKFSERDHVALLYSSIRECLRFKPAGPFGIPHRSTADITVGSYVIPKNSVIVSSVDHIHQYSKFYKDPELFIPDRFIHMTKTIAGAANSNYQERDQFLFGWGRRLCPGTYLAEVELFNGFVHIFSKCNIEPIMDKNNMPLYPDISKPVNSGTAAPPIPFKIRAIERPNKLI